MLRSCMVDFSRMNSDNETTRFAPPVSREHSIELRYGSPRIKRVSLLLITDYAFLFLFLPWNC